MLDPELVRKAKEERDRLVDLQRDVERARSDYHHTIRVLHGAGGSLREIADELGLSHQRVHQIVDVTGGEPGFPQPHFPPFFARRGRRKGGRGFFERFSDEARRVVVSAQEEAQSLGHNYVGTEHLLLGLLLLGEGAAADALRTLGLTHEAARAKVIAIIGEGSVPVTGRLPFTPRSKKALEFALREKNARAARCIEPEHLLLVLAREPETVSAQVLAALGATEESLRAAVEQRLAA
jgi:Clp amino terminal domain, pathogenicity island component